MASISHIDYAQQDDVALWKAKYQKLEEHFDIMKRRNEDLEERMLNLVEKVEGDKIVLSEEIDHLSGQLITATNRVVTLERECARYKKDCVLAVHLLQCQPSNYVQSPNAPPGIPNEQQTQQGGSLVRGGSMVTTFPPMAVYLPDSEEPEVQPEDPAPLMNNLSIANDSGLPTLKSSASFTSEFLQKIEADEDYSCVELRKCGKCASIVSAMSRSTQTPTPQPPRPRIVDNPPKMFLFDDLVGEEHIV